jgi:hypothetical protein
MKAKYEQYGNDCLIYEQVICEDNVVVTVRTYYGSWIDTEPETKVRVCLTNAEARRMFHSICNKLEERHVCLYKEG